MFNEGYKIGIFRGGDSNEYDLSLDTGAHILRNLSDTYDIEDIFISKDMLCHRGGVKIKPEILFSDIDLAINALHGGYGEDGKIQKFFDNYGILYTGSNAVPSAISLQKPLSKKIFEDNGIKTPKHKIIKISNNINEVTLDIFKSFPMPVVLKPISSGASDGIFYADSFNSLKDAVYQISKKYGTIFVEEYIKGIPIICGVVEGFRNEETYSLMPVEINIGEEKYFDYSKRNKNMYICPSCLDNKTKTEIQDMAKKAHNVLNLRHYSKSDFVVSPKRGVYLLETNSLPDLSETSPFVLSLKQAGIEFSHFLDHIINLALDRK